MKEFCVSIPATARIDIIVKAKSEKEAIQKAWEVEYEIDVVDNKENVSIGDFEMHEKVAEGNVCSAVQNSIDVIEN